MNQMKLKFEKLLTAGMAAALGASFIAANPGNASSQNCRPVLVAIDVQAACESKTVDLVATGFEVTTRAHPVEPRVMGSVESGQLAIDQG